MNKEYHVTCAKYYNYYIWAENADEASLIAEDLATNELITITGFDEISIEETGEEE